MGTVPTTGLVLYCNYILLRKVLTFIKCIFPAKSVAIVVTFVIVFWTSLKDFRLTCASERWTVQFACLPLPPLDRQPRICTTRFEHRKTILCGYTVQCSFHRFDCIITFFVFQSHVNGRMFTTFTTEEYDSSHQNHGFWRQVCGYTTASAGSMKQ